MEQNHCFCPQNCLTQAISAWKRCWLDIDYRGERGTGRAKPSELETQGSSAARARFLVSVPGEGHLKQSIQVDMLVLVDEKAC